MCFRPSTEEIQNHYWVSNFIIHKSGKARFSVSNTMQKLGNVITCPHVAKLLNYSSSHCCGQIEQICVLVLVNEVHGMVGHGSQRGKIIFTSIFGDGIFFKWSNEYSSG